MPYQKFPQMVASNYCDWRPFSVPVVENLFENKLKSCHTLMKCTHQPLPTMKITCTMVDLSFSYITFYMMCPHEKETAVIWLLQWKSPFHLGDFHFQTLTCGLITLIRKINLILNRKTEPKNQNEWSKNYPWRSLIMFECSRKTI